MDCHGPLLDEASSQSLTINQQLSGSSSAKPVFTVVTDAKIEDILSEAIAESFRIPKSCHIVEQKLLIRPGANIETNAPDDLDLYKVIFEQESDSDHDMDLAVSPPEEVKDHTLPLGDFKVDSCKLVGGSKFYSMTEEADSTPSPTEKQDHMKPTESDDEVSDVDQECTVFSGVSYLGAQNITDPKSEAEIQRIMKELSYMHESHDGIAVSISIPVCSQGLVVLYEADTNSVMARYTVNRISFYARGATGTPVAACFAFTWSHGETRESAVYRCHVFRCHIAEAVTQVSSCFAKAFERIPRSMASSVVGELSAAPSMSGSLVGSLVDGQPQLVPAMQLMHVLECTVDIKESDAKGTFSQVPKERLGFKLRGGIDKQVTINVQQVNNSLPDTEDSQAPPTGGLYIERCFGILLAPGRSVKHSDMRLLEMVSGSSGGSGCSVCALWNAGESALAAFNVASGDGAPTYMSLALDLVIRGIRDPLRLVIETPVKIFPPTERFWYYSKRPLVQQFFINLKEVIYIPLKENIDTAGLLQYEVATVDTSGELDRSRLNLPLSLSSLLPSPLTNAPAPPSPTEVDSDGDEPLLSGTGEVSKDCGEDVLENWAQVLRRYKRNLLFKVKGKKGKQTDKRWTGQRPRALTPLVRAGVPEALRGEVWLRLAGVDSNNKLMESYRTLIGKECQFESVILRDIARTFPAHEFFREAGGPGQDALLRISRAYSVYDVEVGYCQGLSFLAATLLLHMPEEQAFCLLVRLMYGYGLRELYKDGFENLYMRLHQLHRIMEEQLSDLRAHFLKLGVEPHMFAAQWFLTVFTARFPLPLVYHILDVFLLQGMDTMLQVAVAMMSRWRKDLLAADFEGVLKFFRVTLPKRCRTEESVQQLMKLVISVKVKRLPKYQLEYEKFVKEAAEKEKIDGELNKLRGANIQLQQENETLETQLAEAQTAIKEAQKEAEHHAAVAKDYKEISARIDRQLQQIQGVVNGCAACRAKLNEKDELFIGKGDEKKGCESETASEREVALRQRVRELELQLAQVKLEHVQAQCSNQELSHQLNTALNEAQAKEKQAASPWFSRTLGSIMEAAQNRPTFQTYLQSAPEPAPVAPLRRNSANSQPERRVSESHSPDLHRKRMHKTRSMIVESNKMKDDEMDSSQELTPANMVKNLSLG